MKSIKKPHLLRFILALPLIVASFGLVVVASTPQVSAADPKLTTWQNFIKKKCGAMSADAAERCSTQLNSQLKTKCGAPKPDKDSYVTCWRKFIRDNGGTAGPRSKPDERETPVVSDDSVNCGNVSTNIISCSNSNGDPVSSLLLDIINFLAVGVGIAVVGGIIWGGMLYASSNGDSSKTKQGISVIVNAVIGLLLFIFMYAFLNYLVPGGLFT